MRSKLHSIGDFGLLWIGVAVLALSLVCACGIDGWRIYRDSIEEQAEPTLIVQNPPIEKIPPNMTEEVLLATPLVPTPSVPTQTEASEDGYILLANGDFGTGYLWEDDYMEGRWDLFVADAYGNNRNLLMQIDNSWGGGEFSPNGQWLWFTAKTVGNAETLYVAQADGSDLRKIYSSSTSIDVPLDGYSHDGWVLLFNEADPLFHQSLYNHRNGLTVNLKEYSNVGAISSDGKWASMTSEDDFILVDLETGQWQELNEKTRWIVFSANEQDLILGEPRADPTHKIYNIESGSWSTFDAGEKGTLSILPDGLHMIFHDGLRERYAAMSQEGQRQGDLFLFNRGTDDQTAYLPGYHTYDVITKPWSRWQFFDQMPCSTDKIVVAAYNGFWYAVMLQQSGGDVYVANADGSDLHIIAEDVIKATFLGDREHILVVRRESTEDEDSHLPLLAAIIDLRSGIEYPMPCTVYDTGGGVFYSTHSGTLELSPDGIHILCHEFDLYEKYVTYYNPITPDLINWDTYKLWVLNLDTMELHPLEVNRPEGSWIRPVGFSSNGRRIVYGIQEIDYAEHKILSSSTYTVNPDGSDLRLVSENTMPVFYHSSLLDQ